MVIKVLLWESVHLKVSLEDPDTRMLDAEEG